MQKIIVVAEDSELKLIRPAPQFLESYREACVETAGHVHNDYIIHDPDKYEEWKDTIFAEYRNQEAGTGLPPGFVPSATFWFVIGERYIGTVNIRLKLNKVLENYGGNIGCVTRLSERNKGYATRILPLAVATAKKLGVSPVLVMCTEDNPASLHSLTSARHIKTDTVVTKADGVLHTVTRFWF